jgi:hypothetical protein
MSKNIGAKIMIFNRVSHDEWGQLGRGDMEHG